MRENRRTGGLPGTASSYGTNGSRLDGSRAASSTATAAGRATDGKSGWCASQTSSSSSGVQMIGGWYPNERRTASIFAQSAGLAIWAQLHVSS
jgi:hypothetical protein